MPRFRKCSPTQLDPNNWAFIRAFEILMDSLGAILSIGILFSLFQVKDIEKGKSISLSNQSRRKISDFFTSNFKHFKDQFFRI